MTLAVSQFGDCILWRLPFKTDCIIAARLKNKKNKIPFSDSVVSCCGHLATGAASGAIRKCSARLERLIFVTFVCRLEVKGSSCKNRIVLSEICQNNATNECMQMRFKNFERML